MIVVENNVKILEVCYLQVIILFKVEYDSFLNYDCRWGNGSKCIIFYQSGDCRCWLKICMLKKSHIT